MEEILKSSYDWFKQPEFSRIVMMDPDGWDRTNYQASMEELITRKEFVDRLSLSTITFI